MKSHLFLIIILSIFGGPLLASERPQLPDRETINKLPPDGGPQYNRLIFEQSPYLLQHATNPVDWYPWGDLAFEKARKEDKPIFLSIGYSTCHWCHVMEHGSFEDSEVAELLNKFFICIKVDREERPDIDHIYMSVCQAMTGRGGWPLTVALTPDLKPFFSGTYFPKNSYPNRIGMMDLLPRINEAWLNKRSALEESAEKIMEIFNSDAPPDGAELSKATLADAFLGFTQRFDPLNGGFGEAPKFPTPHQYRFLLRYAERNNNKKALEMVTTSLRKMRQGGIFDHVGKGFHRYSTDANWLVPHFEKMLYDQALLAITYIECYQLTGDPFFKNVADEIFEYVLRDLSHPQGGFYSAEDADSEGVEGKFYVWSYKEIISTLGEEDGSFLAEILQIQREGNFVEESTREKNGDNIPHLSESKESLAKKHSLSESKLDERISSLSSKLFIAREKRIHPFKDDKVLTDWNGLMIAAFAKGYAATGNETYLAAAKKAVAFIWKNLRSPNGNLKKRFRQGESGLNGLLEDYAFMASGLIELYQASYDIDYLEKAIFLTDRSITKFWDDSSKGFFQSEPRPDLVMRLKEIYDGAIPSGNSIQADNLFKLGNITGNQKYISLGHETLTAFVYKIRAQPMGFTQSLCAFDMNLGPTREIVFSTKGTDSSWDSLRHRIGKKFFPRSVFVLRTEENKKKLVELCSYTEFQVPIDGKLTVYLCENFSCQAPETNLNLFLEAMEK